MIVGIDFSITSPGVCILSKKSIKFVGFFNSWGLSFERKTPKKFELCKELNSLSDVEIITFSRQTKKEPVYADDQVRKIRDANNLSKQILKLFKKNVLVGLEGFAYRIKNFHLYDLIAFNSVLRDKLWESGHTIVVVSPTAIKSHAGKGSFDKRQMFDSFVENSHNDPLLKKSSFWKWCVANKTRFGSSIPNPVQDLIDAYWLADLVSKRY